ncbi:perilipin-2-like [Odontesthes bonariensis]|uniref:perilipin-2-like n=1 Tax=Odontesthes bonariensis TaxID=219752 RepID=UPI003F58FC5B
MPTNNNLKVPSAVARLAQLPMVLSARATLSVLYRDTKSINPNLNSMCDALESRVVAFSAAACTTVSPVIVKFEPQISIANNVACKSLDWLAISFPVLLSPTDQVVATAKNKMQEIHDVVSITAKGTVDCVQYAVRQVMSGILQADDGASKSLVERVVSFASVGLDSALSLSEALVDQVLPPSDKDKEDEAHLVEGFEGATHKGRYPERMLSLTTKLFKRTYQSAGSKIQTVQVMESVSRSTTLVQNLRSSWVGLICSLQELPQYLQYRAVSVFFFIAQMYNVSSLPSHKVQAKNGKRPGNATDTSSTCMVLARPQTTPAFRMRPTRTFVFDSSCNVKGCVRR